MSSSRGLVHHGLRMSSQCQVWLSFLQNRTVRYCSEKGLVFATQRDGPLPLVSEEEVPPLRDLDRDHKKV